MYDLLKDLATRPEPFSRYTAKELWTRPYLAQQMLAYHLNQETDLASRRASVIDDIVNWIDFQLDLPGKHLCDLGCGPGLYAQRFSGCGAAVTGVDFSAHSLAYARQQAAEDEMDIRYVEADYLADELPAGFDIVTLIYTDFCVLSPTQRANLLGRIRGMLKPGGQLVMDVAGIGSFAGREESSHIEYRLMGGFWAEGDYIGIQRSLVYAEDHLALDRFLIIEPGETWQIFNWFQHFTAQGLQAELGAAGFTVDEMAGDLAGAPLKPDGELLGVIASASGVAAKN